VDVIGTRKLCAPQCAAVTNIEHLIRHHLFLTRRSRTYRARRATGLGVARPWTGEMHFKEYQGVQWTEKRGNWSTSWLGNGVKAWYWCIRSISGTTTPREMWELFTWRSPLESLRSLENTRDEGSIIQSHYWVHWHGAHIKSMTPKLTRPTNLMKKNQQGLCHISLLQVAPIMPFIPTFESCETVRVRNTPINKTRRVSFK
jgi:hypothetical protein